jgi:hypothetical protein
VVKKITNVEEYSPLWNTDFLNCFGSLEKKQTTQKMEPVLYSRLLTMMTIWYTLKHGNVLLEIVP